MPYNYILYNTKFSKMFLLITLITQGLIDTFLYKTSYNNGISLLYLSEADPGLTVGGAKYTKFYVPRPLLTSFPHKTCYNR